MSIQVVDIDALSAVADAVTVVLGAVVTLLALRAARRTDSKRLGVFAVGFAAITLGTLVELGLRGFEYGPVATLWESVITAIGFGLLAYSLYGTDLNGGTDRGTAPGDA